MLTHSHMGLPFGLPNPKMGTPKNNGTPTTEEGGVLFESATLKAKKLEGANQRWVKDSDKPRIHDSLVKG